MASSVTTAATATAMSSPSREVDRDAVKTMGGDLNVFSTRACDACRALGSVMVLLVIGIVGLTYYATVVVVYWPVVEAGGEDASLATGALIAYHVLVFMLLWSYFACVLTEAGGGACGVDAGAGRSRGSRGGGEEE